MYFYHGRKIHCKTMRDNEIKIPDLTRNSNTRYAKQCYLGAVRKNNRKVLASLGVMGARLRSLLKPQYITALRY